MVKAYASHERSIFDDIAAKRASSFAVAGTAQKAAAEQALQGSLGRLFAVAEGYPQLKADQEFPRLAGSACRDRGSAADGAALFQRHGA